MYLFIFSFVTTFFIALSVQSLFKYLAVIENEKFYQLTERKMNKSPLTSHREDNVRVLNEDVIIQEFRIMSEEIIYNFNSTQFFSFINSVDIFSQENLIESRSLISFHYFFFN